jgi:hypothetical protein
MDSGKWVKDIGKAHDFKLGADAIQFAMDRGLKNVEIIHAFDDPQYNISTGPIDF